MDELKFYLCYTLLLMILLQCWITPCHLHSQHRNLCRDICLPGTLCVLRNLVRRCDYININHQIQDRVRNPHAFISNERYVNPPDLVLDQTFVNHEAVDPSHEMKQEEQHRHRAMQDSERRLYNSRIGQALNHTFRNKIGRGTLVDNIISPRTVEVIHDFASAGRIHVKDRPQTGEGMGEIRKEQDVQTTPSVRQTVTTGASASCTPCDENTKCSEGNYCYYSPICAVRICQPLT